MKAVVCHAGSRDYYQAAWALSDVGLLERLVTEFYFDPHHWHFPRALLDAYPKLACRCCPGLRPKQVTSPLLLAIQRAMLIRMRTKLRQLAIDQAIGSLAREIAAESGAAVLSYSYYASTAFAEGPDRPSNRVLFQLHPHPASIRRLFNEELSLMPVAAANLRKEDEIESPPGHFDALCSEALLANGWIVASSYTAETLAENGVPRDKIQIVPYGVDTDAFPARNRPPEKRRPLRLIWVGRIIQRKGIWYLIKALRRFKPEDVELVICAFGLDEPEQADHFGMPNVKIILGLPTRSIVEQLHQADLFVLPSLTEGFAHVILEAMAAGLPILTTPNTCAPDVITEGHEGFVVPIRDSAALAARIEWAISNRERLYEMGAEAARRAREFTWARFRRNLVSAYQRAIEIANNGILSKEPHA